MNIQVISDVHTEFHKDNGTSFLPRLKPAKSIDVLVAAGDIVQLSNKSQSTEFIGKLCSIYPHVVFVAGNHEYYGTSLIKGNNILYELEDTYSNFHFLERSFTTIKGQRFVGASMWYHQQPFIDATWYKWSDFREISNLFPAYKKYSQDEAKFLQREVKSSDIVVTHFVPLECLNHPDYTESPFNPYFCIDQNTLITERKPKLWIYGHTHYGQRRVLPNGTITLGNPYGYEPDMLVPMFSYSCIEHV